MLSVKEQSGCAFLFDRVGRMIPDHIRSLTDLGGSCVPVGADVLSTLAAQSTCPCPGACRRERNAYKDLASVSDGYHSLC